MSRPRRVLAIALDATDATLVRRWADAGELPNVARLMAGGATAPLDSLADWMPESVWPSLHTGCSPGNHGVFHVFEPRPGSYALARRPGRSYRQPWWRLLAGPAAPARGPLRTILVDVPSTSVEPSEHVTHVYNWGQRDATRTASWPPELLDQLTARHGRYARNFNREVTGRPLLARGQLRSVLRMTERRAELLAGLLASSRWDACLAVFPEPHYAAHALYQYADGMPHLERAPRGWGLGGALLESYRAADRAVGELASAAGPETTLALFSGIGLRPNTSGPTLLRRLMIALGHQVPAVPAAGARGQALARRAALTAMPRPVARALKRRFIPTEAVDRHLERVWVESTDWGRTRAWAEGDAGSGWVRINVRGRDPLGTVAPGAEYDELCDRIAAELRECRDAATGLPAFERVARRDELVTGPNEDRAPDLLLKFTRRAVLRAVEHPVAGRVEDDGYGWRATEHNPNAWLALNGPGVRPGAHEPDARAQDLAPTLMHLLGAPVPADLDGRVLERLLDPELGPVRHVEADCHDDAWIGAAP